MQAYRSVADVYERGRPGYPPEAVAYLASRLELGPGRVVVDVAAGTGKLTRALVGTGATVVAVEPLREMRAVLAETAPAAEAVEGTAEQLPLEDGSVDAITVAQAFHWFDAQAAIREFGRVLRPGGALALVWNIRDLGDPVQWQLNELLAPYRGNARSEHEQPWREDIGASPLFGAVEQRSFPWVQAYTADDLTERIASVSFVAGLADDVRLELLDRVRALGEGAGETFPFRYRTDVYVFPRSRDQEPLRAG